MTLSARPVTLAGAFNARAFVSSSTGRPWLVRSSALDALTPDGARALRALGVGRVVDLRDPGEGGPASHDVDIVAIPVYGFAGGVPELGRLEELMERVLVTRAETLARIVGTIADSSVPVSVHCTIGKDRTGLVIALAMLAAGAPEEDVIDDYALSGAEVLPHRRELVARMLAERGLAAAEAAEAWRLNVQSPPEVMRAVIAWLATRGGAAAFLRDHGVTEDALSRLRARL